MQRDSDEGFRAGKALFIILCVTEMMSDITSLFIQWHSFRRDRGSASFMQCNFVRDKEGRDSTSANRKV